MDLNADVEPVPAVPASHAKRLFVGGIIVSVVYVAALAVYALCVGTAMVAMKPDEFATFLSGVFAPLAFLWLVLGFRQQGDELQNSARALWLQGEELRNSVEQQRQLVEVSREQLASELGARQLAEAEAERAAQPQLLMLHPGGSFMGPQRNFTITATSGGPTCSDVRMLINGVVVARTTVLAEDGRLQHIIAYERPEDVHPLDIVIVYTDYRGNRRQQQFHFPVDETGGPGQDRSLTEAHRVVVKSDETTISA